MTTSRARVVYSTSMACRLYARSDEMHDISETQNSWQSIARRHLHGARLKLKCLALSMSKEMPGILLEYLSPSAPPMLSSLNKQVQASTSCLETLSLMLAVTMVTMPSLPVMTQKHTCRTQTHAHRTQMHFQLTGTHGQLPAVKSLRC